MNVDFITKLGLFGKYIMQSQRTLQPICFRPSARKSGPPNHTAAWAIDISRYVSLSCRFRGIQTLHIQTLPSPPWYRVQLPALLPGTRCYTDASTSPDMHQQVRRTAGLGVFIVNNHQQPTSPIYIKAVVTNINSVLMAEASAMVLAASILTAMNITSPTFLTDNQQLVTYFNAADRSSPPQWDIKHITQEFINLGATNNFRVFKIARSMNTTAHLLATQAYRSSDMYSNAMSITCSRQDHVITCPLREALNILPWEGISLSAASRC